MGSSISILVVEYANPNSKLRICIRVMYKVKTTQPMWYFVRPNFDVLDAGEEVE